MTFREAKKILKKNGWVHVRTNGSHVQFKKAGVDFTANVPCHGSKDLSIGVLKSLEKGTGLSFT
ncbi:type II toxin-antitoxin system HicA family toxin [Alkalibacterium olivapovliticus]|uniref:Putative RNA binding protein YcfA (HicA-like mRNA interferase family) n=1 Tax=Alkalibacterium olivapovliticus TaxID=99907 RepID=A0A2T0W3V0_9LACT|nr:type II toxin-antitoxin system HicA family toxin [Alkalibacterium olivapovliticus]PRY80137.1 putative RNA binding protein YcfA (HicA-like mRNA interferase family) [Alkalibacterium olivapovliticus]